MKFVAKTLYGLEKVLEKELIALGANDVTAGNRAVYFDGDLRLLYKANYCLRTALSILMPVREFRIRSKDDLYKNALKIEWDQFMDTGDTFSVMPVVNSPLFGHTGYPGLILKDAVADFFRNKTGRRPSVNSNDPALMINLHVSNELATISIDSSVIPLFKRGYRKESTVAPLNEVLAAGIILMSGWDAKSPFLDPMCGSGTFPVEAALLASNIAPGRYREHFGFMRWRGFDKSLFEEMKAEAEKNVREPSVTINCSDILQTAVDTARANIQKAGLGNLIRIKQSDFRDLQTDDSKPVIFMNPPYGQRIVTDEIDELYSMIGSTLKHKYAGSTAWIITTDTAPVKNIGLKAGEKHTLYNGALQCTLLRFEMFGGTRKQFVTSAAPSDSNS
jgi:putative N6-adenine-specific DNA methylase